MNPTQPGKVFWLVVLAAIWAFFGLTGRGAWQAEEALALGDVLDRLENGRSLWATPAPLYTLVASLLARWTPFGLDIQDSARLASGVFILISLAAIGLAARRLLGRGYGAAATLALMGGFGLLLRAHAFIPETALLAAWAMMLWGLGWSHAQPKAGGILMGLSLTALSLGLRGVPDLVAGLAVMLLPMAFPSWRERPYRRALMLALGLGGVLIGAGLALISAAGQWEAWLKWHGIARLTPVLPVSRLFSELAWFAWPLWPLALAAVWHDHRRLGRSRELHLPLVACAVLALAALMPAWSRMGGLLPLLLPLALLAAWALPHLRRGAAQAFYWFGVLCFLFFALAFWVYFAAIEWGIPAKLAAHMAKLTPLYVQGSVQSSAIWLAAATTLVWLVAIPLFPRAQTRPVLVWSTGMFLLWVLLATLFRPWAEAGWGYRPLVEEIGRRLPAADCMETRVDPAMHTMLRYHLADRLRASPTAVCAWRLSLELRGKDDARPGASEATAPRVVWEGARPRYKNQVYRLEKLRDE
jgi:4-amino-4-deoxy-L-arabinose transferase-like glycosyltransferase